MPDSRTLKALLKEIAASPVPVAELHLTEKGQISRIVLAHGKQEEAPRRQPVAEKEREEAPKGRRRTMIDSLRLVPAIQASEPDGT